jgi:hypothetical protein
VPRGIIREDLDAGGVQSPLLHPAQNLAAGPVIPHRREEDRVRAQGLEMPGYVERGTAEHPGAVRELVEENFPEEGDPGMGAPVQRWGCVRDGIVSVAGNGL